MIVNLRGTHGSGKSTVARTIIDRYGGVPDPGPKGRPLGYTVNVPGLSTPLYVVGSYETACGGCDSIQPYGDIWPRVVVAASHGHVLFEGALVSSSYGEIGRASETYGDDFVFVVLGTPLSVCLQRVAARRRARGDVRPLDPKNTEVKYNNVLKSIPKIRALGRRVVVIDHKLAVPRTLELFRAAETDRPR